MTRKFVAAVSREAEWVVSEASLADEMKALGVFQFAEREAVFNRLLERTENMDETGFAFCLRDKKTGELSYVMDISFLPGRIDKTRDIPEFQEVCEFVLEVEGRDAAGTTGGSPVLTCTFVEILEWIAREKRAFRKG